MPNRRELILQMALTGGALMLPSAHGALPTDASPLASKSLRLLILGGTGYIGPHVVRTAVARGHKVAVFNRGRNRADLPAKVEQLIGDRTGNLESIKHRDWDAVLDLSTYVPSWVRTLGEAIRDRVKHYTFISTVAVYERPQADAILSEGSPIKNYEGTEDPYSLAAPRTLQEYSGLKALSEGESQVQFPGRTAILRPGYIVGPGDPNGVVPYWLVRIAKGGEVLIAGDRSTPVQFIDVRDLAECAISMAEKQTIGIYNVVGPSVPSTLEQFISTAQRTVSTSPKSTWVPTQWLASQKHRELWSRLLFWSGEPEGWGWTMQMRNERALSAGMTLREMSTTLSNVWEWCRLLPDEQLSEFLPQDKENSTGEQSGRIPWQVYLEREKAALRDWHSQQTRAD